MKPNCQQFWSDRTFLNTVFPLVPQKSSETALSHIFSQQCKAKQLKSYKVIIYNCLKCSEKNQDLPINEMDCQGLKLKGPGHSCLGSCQGSYYPQALDRWTLNNFPMFATGVRIFRASNNVGPLFLGPGSTRILEINTK